MPNAPEHSPVTTPFSYDHEACDRVTDTIRELIYTLELMMELTPPSKRSEYLNDTILIVTHKINSLREEFNMPAE